MPTENEQPDLDVEELQAEGVADVDEKAETFPEPQPISYFGADFDVVGLVRRLDAGDIVIPTFDPTEDPAAQLAGFQRRFVWRKYQMDRFVESLLLEYPVPGIFLVQQPNKKLLVLDGQQRLRTLQAFYGGTIDKDTVFKLESVGSDFEGLMYADLTDEMRRTLDNTFIRATIVKYNPEAKGDEAVYQVFERLNTGGTNLYPHEIRVALYNGKLARLVRDLNYQPGWRKLYALEPSYRLKDQELVLRFIALFIDFPKYKRPLKGFLNTFMKEHRDLEGLDEAKIRGIFSETCAALEQGVGTRAFRVKTQVNAALVDSVLVGVARRLMNGPISQPQRLGPAFDDLVAKEDFQTAIGRATADEERVERRLSLATAAFSQIP